MFLDVSWLEPPKVFVSSTMEDPNQVYRKNIIKALNSIGTTILDFQDDSFPYSGSTKHSITKETIAAVRAATALILIIGKRYGYLLSDKSVVHLEYEEAKSINIPVLAFIDERVWNDFRRGIKKSDYIEGDSHYNFIAELAFGKLWPFRDEDDCISHITKQFNNFLGGFLRFNRQATWLWNEWYTRSIEQNAREVWIITPDFYWDFDDTEFRDIVTNNLLNRCCKYRYMYKSSPTNDSRVAEMSRIYTMLLIENGKKAEDLNELLYFLPVKENEFHWASEQILFNPFSLDERAIMVDIMDVRDKTQKFNIEFGRSKRVTFRYQFAELWNSRISNPALAIDIKP